MPRTMRNRTRPESAAAADSSRSWLRPYTDACEQHWWLFCLRLRWLQQFGWFSTWFTQVASLPSKNHLQSTFTTIDLHFVDLKTNSGSLGLLATPAVGSSRDLVCTVACREGVCVQERWTGVRHRCERLSPICPWCSGETWWCWCRWWPAWSWRSCSPERPLCRLTWSCSSALGRESW